MVKTPYDIEVAWQINDFCDFDCAYCWLHERDWTKSKRFAGIQDTQKVINSFNNAGLVWLVHMSGGEPFFSPHFIELCQGLTQTHYISINTNLSHKDVARFAKTINPEKVEFIHASLHITERKKQGKVKDFIQKYHTLKTRGFNIFVSYLMHPSILGRFEKDYAYFKSEGIILRPKIFWGDYYGIFGILNTPIVREVNRFNHIRSRLRKQYPNSYTDTQKNLIKAYIEKSRVDEGAIGQKHDAGQRTVDLSLDKNWADGLLSFRGRPCLAGVKFVKMDQYGKVYRCNDETKHYLGNLFNGGIKLLPEPIECSAEICSCPYVGSRYASNQILCQK